MNALKAAILMLIMLHVFVWRPVQGGVEPEGERRKKFLETEELSLKQKGIETELFPLAKRSMNHCHYKKNQHLSSHHATQRFEKLCNVQK
ncbi:Uncharacterised protein [Acinetobacter baumannii]|nr:Uncharacterised protein [Acinetobacter baumannii]